MRSKLFVLILLHTLAFSPIGSTVGQQQGESVEQLKEQIKQMESVDRDRAIPDEVKNLNRKFLNSRRQQLQDLLTKRLVALRAYQSKMDSALTTEEKKLIGSSIQQLEAVLREQEQALSAANNSVTDAVVADGDRNDNGKTKGSPIPEQSSTMTNSASKGGKSPAVGDLPASINSNFSTPSATINIAPPPACTGGYPDPPPRLDDMARATAVNIVNRPTNVFSEFGRHFNELVYLTIADALFTDAEKVNLSQLRWQEFSAETRRTDKQIGASSRAGGSTSAIEKPNFSDLLSFAIEHGAIQKEVNQTSLTLSSSPYALIAAAQGDTSDVYRQYEFFTRIGISANFNLANQDNVLANASRRQLNEWSVKFRLNPDRTARGRDFQKYWNDNVLPKIGKRAIVLTKGYNQAFNDVPALGTLRENVLEKFEKSDGFLLTTLNNSATASPAEKTAALKQEILCRLRTEVYDPLSQGTITVNDEFRTSLNQTIVDYAEAQREAEEGKNAIRDELKRLADKPTASISYTNIRPSAGSFYSVFKGLYLQKAFAPVSIIANGELSIYHNPNPLLNQQRLRDALFAVSLEGRAGRSPFVTTDMDESPVTFSFTGSYQRMLENTRGLNKKADIAAAQFKLDIPVFTGFSLPLAVTYSNASEQEKKRHFRFNFGFGLDADKLALLLLAKRALGR
jgi:hypothetical protein